MAKIQANEKQLLFDFTFSDITEHVTTVVTPEILKLEKELSVQSNDVPPENVKEEQVSFDNSSFQPFGAWLSFDRRLSLSDRNQYNALSLEIIKKPHAEITDQERNTLRLYSGFGGTGQENEQGVLYDYYTSPPIADMTWKLLNTIKPIHKGSAFLEPSCGTGVFFSTAPKDVNLTGVELDSRTAAIARALHPQADIKNMSFESFNSSAAKAREFDYVIGNAPFGDRSVDTKFIDMPKEKSLDRYFITRGIDALTPNGVMAIIVHPGILDNETNQEFRAEVARKAAFLGAIRLNDHSFAHTHTKIQPDILFFQKHPQDIEQHLAQIPDEELDTVLEKPFISSGDTYYKNFPQHIMGTLNEGSGQWGHDVVEGQVTPDTIEKTINAFSFSINNSPLSGEQREQFYQEIRERYPVTESRDSATVAPEDIIKALTEGETKRFAEKELRTGSVKVENDSVYVLTSDIYNYWSRVPKSENISEKVEKILALSSVIRDIRQGMMEQDSPVASPLPETTYISGPPPQEAAQEQSTQLQEQEPSAIKKLQIQAEQILSEYHGTYGMTFEDFGCDALFVDEAHRYKNLFTSSLSREIGLNDGRQSNKAMALFKKASYIREKNDNKNVFLFTATPLTNSPLEYYNMMMIFAPQELEKYLIDNINSFIHNFTDIQNTETYDWKTGQITTKKTLVGFKNIHTLQDIFFKYTDYQNDPKAINLEKPDSVLSPNIIHKDSIQAAAVKTLSDELEKFTSCNPEEKEKLFPHQNYLTFYTKLRTASLDLELYNAKKYHNWNNPKLNTLTANAYQLFQDTKAGQIIFCDRVFSSDKNFNLHDKIKSALVSKGFKKEEIAIVNGFTKSGNEMSDGEVESQVSSTVADFNAGKYNIIIGTTGCIGEGLNLQANTCAVHHLDIPFRPSDFIQRNGRGDRQGNEQANVHIKTYMAQGTIDTYSVNLVQNKANWIDELLRSKTNVFVNKDDESSINPTELLLALSEEWGDMEKVQALRESIKHQQEVKLIEERETRRKTLLNNLAKYRAPLYNYHGRTDTFSYRQRMERINNIEKTLLSIPTFTDREILGGKKPFLYSLKTDTIITEGDYYNDGHKAHCLVTKLYPPLQEMQVTNIIGGNTSNIHIDDLDDEKHRYRSGSYTFIRSPAKEFLNIVPLFHSKEFYGVKDSTLKEQCYYTHIQSYDEKFSPLPLFKLSGKNLLINYTTPDNEYHRFDTSGYLNPFCDTDLEKIKSAETLSFGYLHDDTSFREVLQAVKNTTPRVFKEISNLLPLIPPNFNSVVYSHSNDADNFKDNIKKLCKYPFYKNDPMKAAKDILENASDEDKQDLKKELRKMGCVNAETTKNVIQSLAIVKPDEQSREGHAKRDFFNKHVRVSGISL